MLKRKWIPTRLNSASERRVAIATSRPPGPLRTLRIVSFLFLSFLRWTLNWLRARLGVRSHSAEWAGRVRRDIEALGGLWIKAGQLVALRRDMFSPEFCEELSKLQDGADGFPAEIAIATIERDLGRPIAAIFSEFDTAPIAAASIGQIHRARLPSGMEVAVKVQRPYVSAVLHRDFRVLRRLVTLAEWLRVMPNGRWRVMLWELQRMMRSELDYRLEAASIRRMKESLRPHRVYVPKVVEAASSDAVLTMEFIDGVLLSDYIRESLVDAGRASAWMRENDIDPHEVGLRIYHTHTRQVFEDNLFHCDLHPGNIMLLRRGRIALIDFGSVGSIDVSKLKQYYMILQAIAEGDYLKVADLFLLIAPWVPDLDVETVKGDIVRVMREWADATPVKTLPYHEKSLGFVIQRVADVFRRYQIPIAWDFMQVNRAELTMDFSLMYLIPDIDYHEMMRDYEDRARMRTIVRSFSDGQLVRRAVAWVSALDVPVNYAENIFFQGRLLRRQAMNVGRGLASGELALYFLAQLSARAALVATVVLALAWSETRWPSRLGAICFDLTSRVFSGSGEWGTLLWILVIAAAAHTTYSLSRINRRMAMNQRDAGITRLS